MRRLTAWIAYPFSHVRVRKGVVFLSLLLISTLSHAQDLKTKKAELVTVSHQIQSLQETIMQNHHLVNDLQQQLKSAELNVSNLSLQLSEHTQALADEEQTIDDLKTKQQTILTQLNTQNAALAQQIRASYQLGQAQQWKVMLNQDNWNAFSRHLTYYRYLADSRGKLIKDINHSLTELSTTIRAEKKHENQLKRLVEQTQHQQDRQKRILNLRQKLIAKLGLQTQSKQQQMEVLVNNQKILQETIKRLSAQAIVINSQSLSHLQGKLAWPVQGPILTSYGSQLDVGSLHANGVVIKASPGTPVHAIAPGRVIFADWLRGFGLLVIINHGNSYMSLYGRNQMLYAKVGNYVNTGDVIAATGDTGGYKNSSLYFEMRQNGSPVNPATWCR